MKPHVEDDVVRRFGEEWQRFDQRGVSPREMAELFELYFHIFPWDALPPNAEGIDAGCGSGRWAAFVAPRVGRLHCVDASTEALRVARDNLRALTNCEFHNAPIEAMPLPKDSFDFAYALGVLHHVPDTAAGIEACVAKLKPGAPFLLYVYYKFDNKPAWYRLLWRVSQPVRALLSRSPRIMRHAGAEAAAAVVYFPLARLARLFERAGMNVETFPLSFYRRRSYYVMRTDALDRFGTPLEKRFTRDEIAAMMERAGLRDIVFSEAAPYWCAVGIKSRQ